jgi:hypothetical protein
MTDQETVPKLIGNMLVKKSQDDIQYFVYNEVRTDSSLLDTVGEDPAITLSRETTMKAIETLKKARNMLRKDFDTDNPNIN